MSRKLLKFAAWACLCVIAYSTLSPLRDRPTVLTSSALEHLAAFALLGIVFRVAYPRSTLTVLTIVLGSAGLFELLQLFTLDRHARILDALQKLAGGTAGVFAGRAVLGFDRARFWLLRDSTPDPSPEIRGKAVPRHVSRAIEKAAQIASRIKLHD